MRLHIEQRCSGLRQCDMQIPASKPKNPNHHHHSSKQPQEKGQVKQDSEPSTL